MHERDHRLTLLGRVRSALAEAGVPHALIGAAALALYGVSRSTYDIDLLATERSCLDQAFWAPLSASGAVLEVRKGDLDDPLAGVVRFTEPAPADPRTPGTSPSSSRPATASGCTQRSSSTSATCPSQPSVCGGVSELRIPRDDGGGMCTALKWDGRQRR